MTWTTPRTWGTGDLVTAADLNEQVRDNLAYLKTATTFDTVEVDTNYSSTATFFTDVDTNNLTLTVNTRGKLALVGFEVAARQSQTSHAICFDVTVDGNRVGSNFRGLAYHRISNSRDVNAATPVSAQHWLANLTAGTHVIKLVWLQISASGDTGYIDNTAGGGMPTRLWLMEFDI